MAPGSSDAGAGGHGQWRPDGWQPDGWQPDGWRSSAAAPAGPGNARGFGDVPARDHVINAVCFVLLAASLTLAWQSGVRAGGQLPVLLATLLPLLSLALFYLARLGLLGRWSDSRIRLVRVLAGAPYIAIAAIHVLLDAGTAFSVPSGRDVGPAIGIGLAAVVLTISPRRAELTDDTAAVARRWRPAIIGTITLTALLQLLALAAMLRPLLWADGLPTELLLYLLPRVPLTLLFAALLIVPLWRTATGDRAWRAVLLGLGGATALWLLAHEPLSAGYPWIGYPSASTGTAVVVLLPTAAALAISPAMAGSPAGPASARRARTARLAAGTSAAILLADLIAWRVLQIGLLRAWGGSLTWPVIAGLLLMVLAMGAALTTAIVMRAAPRSDHGGPQYPGSAGPSRAELPALIAMGVSTLAVWAHVIVQSRHTGHADSWILASVTPIWTGAALPAVVLVALLAHRIVPMHGSPGAAHGFTAAHAADPATAPAVLARIAQEAPELRAHLAANPAAYPALLDWLGGLGDPAVTAALRRRGHG